MPLTLEKYMIDILPLAIYIELYFCDSILYDLFYVRVSPIVMLHYLAFQCYHELGQYDHRDNALYHLLDAVKADDFFNSLPHYHSLNIGGHCLLIAGDKDRARDMFTSSLRKTELLPKNFNAMKGTAAAWYLQHFC